MGKNEVPWSAFLGRRRSLAYWLKAHSEGEAAFYGSMMSFFGTVAESIKQKLHALEANPRLRTLDAIFHPPDWDGTLLAHGRYHVQRLVRQGAGLEWGLSSRTRSINYAFLDILKRPQEIVLPDKLEREVQQHTEAILKQGYWRDITDTLKDQITGAIQRGLDRGASGSDIVKEVNSYLTSEATQARAARVARTETTGALGTGADVSRDELARQGLLQAKEWAAVGDSHTRSDHAALDGTRVGPDEDFVVGGEKCRFPGDWDLSAEQRCNCRCAILSILTTASGDVVEQSEPQDADSAPAQEPGSGAPQALLMEPYTPLGPPVKPGGPDKPVASQIAAWKEGDRLVQEAYTLAAPLRAAQNAHSSAQADLTMFNLQNRDKPNTQEILSQRGKLYQAVEDAENRKKAVAREVNAAIHNTLKAPNPIAIEDAALKRRPGKKLVEETKAGIDFVAKVTGRKEGEEIRLQPTLHNGGPEQRACCDWRDGKSTGTLIMNSTSDRRVVVHEMGHALEAALPGAHAACVRFLEERCGQEPVSELKTVFPTYGFDATEHGRKDNFDAVWTGAGPYYVGKKYTHKGLPDNYATEILSMGIEKLHEDPSTFAHRDPEFYKFVVGVLHGEFR